MYASNQGMYISTHMPCVHVALQAITLWSSAVTSQLVYASIRKSTHAMSLSEALDLNYHICGQDYLGDKLMQGTQLPSPSQRWHPQVLAARFIGADKRRGLPYSPTGSLDAMDAGICEGAVRACICAVLHMRTRWLADAR